MKSKKIKYIIYKYDDIRQDIFYKAEFIDPKQVIAYINHSIKNYITKSLDDLKITKNNYVIFKDINR